MAGKVVPLVPKRVFDFSNSAASTTPQLVVFERIDISQYIDCMLAVRVHSTAMAGGNSLAFDLYGDGFTIDDPGLFFRTASPLFSSQSITGGGPALLTYGGTVRGHFATLVVSANKSVGGNANVVASIDVILRSPDAQ